MAETESAVKGDLDTLGMAETECESSYRGLGHSGDGRERVTSYRGLGLFGYGRKRV